MDYLIGGALPTQHSARQVLCGATRPKGCGGRAVEEGRIDQEVFLVFAEVFRRYAPVEKDSPPAVEVALPDDVLEGEDQAGGDKESRRVQVRMDYK